MPRKPRSTELDKLLFRFQYEIAGQLCDGPTLIKQLNEEGASVPQAIRQLQGEPVVHVKRLEDTMYGRQNRNYYSQYPQRGWNDYPRRRSQLDDVWMPNYDDDDEDCEETKHKWDQYQESREQYYNNRYKYDNYQRPPNASYRRPYGQPIPYDCKTKNARYSTFNPALGYYRNVVKSGPYSYPQQSRIPSATPTVSPNNSQQSRIPSSLITVNTSSVVDGKSNFEVKAVGSTEDVQRSLPCTKEQSVSEKSVPDISETDGSPSVIEDSVVSEKSSGNREEQSTVIKSIDESKRLPEGNKDALLIGREPSLDPLSNPEFHSIVVNLKNCLASSEHSTRDETEFPQEIDNSIPGVVEIEVEIMPYPDETTYFNCDNSEAPINVDSDTDTIVYDDADVVTLANINTTCSFLNCKQSTPVFESVATFQHSVNPSVKRKNEDSAGGKTKISKVCDHETAKPTKRDNCSNKQNNVNEKVMEHDGSKVIPNSTVPRSARITKRRKTIHVTESEHSKSSRNDTETNVKMKRSKSVEPSIFPRRITRLLSQELGLTCESLPPKYREHTKPTRRLSRYDSYASTSSHVGGNIKVVTRRRRRIIRDSTDEDSDHSSVSYRSSSPSETKRRRASKASKQIAKPKIIPTSPVNTKALDPRLHKAQTTSTLLCKPDEKSRPTPKDLPSPSKKQTLVRVDDFLHKLHVTSTSTTTRMDLLFGPNSDTEDTFTRWSPQPENMIWSPQLDITSDDSDCNGPSGKGAGTTSKKENEKRCSQNNKSPDKTQCKKIPWDHSLRNSIESKEEENKVNRRLSIGCEEGGNSNKTDSRRPSLQQNATGKQESEKINKERRSSCSDKKRRSSLTPITNTCVSSAIKGAAKKIEARRPSSMQTSSVSGDATDSAQKIENKRPSTTHNHIESKGNDHNSKPSVKKVDERRPSLTHASKSDAKKDHKKTNNKEKNNNERRKSLHEKELHSEKRKPSIDKRRLSVELKHAIASQLPSCLKWESILNLVIPLPECKTAQHCKHGRLIKRQEVTIMPLITTHNDANTIEQPRVADPLTNPIDNPSEESDVIILDSDDEADSSFDANSGLDGDRDEKKYVDTIKKQEKSTSNLDDISNINSINNLMREITNSESTSTNGSPQTTAVLSNLTSSPADANLVKTPSNNKQPIPAIIQTSNAASLNTNETSVEIPVTVTAVPSRSPEPDASKSTVTEKLRQIRRSSVPNTNPDMPDLTVTLLNNAQSKTSCNPSTSAKNVTVHAVTFIPPVVASNKPNMPQCNTGASKDSPVTPTEPVPPVNSASNITNSSNIPLLCNARQILPQIPIVQNAPAQTTPATNAGSTVNPDQQFVRVFLPTLVSHEDFTNTFAAAVLIFTDVYKVDAQMRRFFETTYRMDKEVVRSESRHFTAAAVTSLHDLAERLLNYLRDHKIVNFSLKELLRCFYVYYRKVCNTTRMTIPEILYLFHNICNRWNATVVRGFLLVFVNAVRQLWDEWLQKQNTVKTQANARNNAVQNNSNQNLTAIHPSSGVQQVLQNRGTRNATQNQAAQYGTSSQAPPPPYCRSASNEMGGNLQSNLRQGLMIRDQIDQFLLQCKSYRRIDEYLRRSLPQFGQQTRAVPNVQTQCAQQQHQYRGNSTQLQQLQRQVSVETSTSEELRRHAQINAQLPYSGQNQLSPSLQLQQQVHGLAHAPQGPDVIPRTNISWVPNQTGAAIPQQVHRSYPQTTSQTPLLQSLVLQPSLHQQPPRSFNPFPNDEFRIRLPLSEPVQAPSTSASSTSTAVRAAAPAEVSIGDCIDAAIKRILNSDAASSGPVASTSTLANSSEGLKSEPDDDIIDVDKWYEKKMNEEVVCLNPEYFSEMHIKPDVKTDVADTEGDLETAVESDAINQGGVQQQTVDPTPLRIASADSGFSSPPRQIEQTVILSGDRMCICAARKAEMVCGCKLAIYCSEACQLVDWPNHQLQCIAAMQSGAVNRST